MKKRKTRADELRSAAQILWHGGIALSTIYVKSALPDLPGWTLIPIYLVCMALQYAVTLIESAVFSGSIPPPWSARATTKTSYIWVGASIVLLMDLLVNLGGVGTVANFLKDSATGDVLKNNFSASDTALNIIAGLMIIALAFLFAVGSELLKMYAETIEDPKVEVTFKEVPETEESKKITEDRKKQRQEMDNSLGLDPDLFKQLENARSKANYAPPNKRKP
jgi:hypothetical protein